MKKIGSKSLRIFLKKHAQHYEMINLQQSISQSANSVTKPLHNRIIISILHPKLSPDLIPLFIIAIALKYKIFFSDYIKAFCGSAIRN